MQHDQVGAADDLTDPQLDQTDRCPGDGPVSGGFEQRRTDFGQFGNQLLWIAQPGSGALLRGRRVLLHDCCFLSQWG